MLSQKTLDKIVYEYQHGGVKNFHPEISLSERKALLRYLFSLPSKCSAECEATHTAQTACRVDFVSAICYYSTIKKGQIMYKKSCVLCGKSAHVSKRNIVAICPICVEGLQKVR